MFDIFAKSFMNATLHTAQTRVGPKSHYPLSERFDNRESAEMEAHLTGRRP